MSSQRIREVALELFTKKGYEGASLADIAELVGIKKSSIYNHYKSKDDLFLTIFEICCQKELTVIKGFFEKNKALDLFPLLCAFLKRRLDDVEHSIQTLFLFRFIIFPPMHLVDELALLKKHYLAISQMTIQDPIANHPQLEDIDPVVVQKFIHAFLTMLNGVSSEKLYGRTINVEDKLEALWCGFERYMEVKHLQKVSVHA